MLALLAWTLISIPTGIVTGRILRLRAEAELRILIQIASDRSEVRVPRLAIP